MSKIKATTHLRCRVCKRREQEVEEFDYSPKQVENLINRGFLGYFTDLDDPRADTMGFNMLDHAGITLGWHDGVLHIVRFIPDVCEECDDTDASYELEEIDCMSYHNFGGCCGWCWYRGNHEFKDITEEELDAILAE